jgi:hypothetical protein
LAVAALVVAAHFDHSILDEAVLMLLLLRSGLSP